MLGLLGMLIAVPSWAQRTPPGPGPTTVVGTARTGMPMLRPGVRRLVDIAYGPDPHQRMDVYLPLSPHAAPVLVLVHGGAWMYGDKSAASVVNRKVAHWVGGFGLILVSVDYRRVPQVDPLAQARDVARALATVQARAARWGGDPARIVLMGHSGGAHLVALVSASPALARQQGARPWLGTVMLDSAALDIAALMRRRHARFYDRAFGTDPALWHAASPTDVLGSSPPPMLLVCSTQRRDDSCAQARQFAERVAGVGGRAIVLPENLSHEQINAALGQPGAYTRAVDAFIDSVGALPRGR